MTFDPDWASPPGETISDLLRLRGMTIEDLAIETDTTLATIRSVIQGRLTITIALARRLEKVLGAPREFWISRDFQYRQQVVTLRGDTEHWVQSFPMSDMVRFGWLDPPPHPTDEVAACLRFFDVATVKEWHARYDAILETVAFRTSPTFESWSAATAAWIRQGEIQGAKVECRPWSHEGFATCLQRIKTLTRTRQPHVFFPKLQEIAAANGVAVVVVRLPAGCRASGATRFLSRSKALILLSFRHLSDDHFWFSFFHEAGHLLLHESRDWVLEGTDNEVDVREHEANRFAEEALIPSSLHSEFRALKLNHKDVIRFARRAGISPGIVVGQMQHHGIIEHSQLNRLKRRYRWSTVTLEKP